MGRKIPFDQAQKLAATSKNESIFAPPNKYGYQININHPKVRPFYEFYKERLGERILSDKQRLQFEETFIKMIHKESSK